MTLVYRNGAFEPSYDTWALQTIDTLTLCFTAALARAKSESRCVKTLTRRCGPELDARQAWGSERGIRGLNREELTNHGTDDSIEWSVSLPDRGSVFEPAAYERQERAKDGPPAFRRMGV
jgi:hypothetical protein